MVDEIVRNQRNLPEVNILSFARTKLFDISPENTANQPPMSILGTIPKTDSYAGPPSKNGAAGTATAS